MVIPMDLQHRWIYNLSDYRQIFALTDVDLQKSILDYPGRLSSVNAEIAAAGGRMISINPLFSLSPQEMQKQAQTVLSQCEKYMHISGWQQNMEIFLSDYAIGKREGRYLPGAELQKKEMFDLLLSADFLFDNSQNCNVEELMNELCLLATDIRAFPLPDEQDKVFSQLGPIMLEFQKRNFGIEVKAISYPLRQDAKAMLRIWAKECKVIL